MAINLAEQFSTRKSLGFYTSAQASRITRIPAWTLYSWRRNGIVKPKAKWTDEFDKEHIGYTFENLVFIRLLRILRDKGITLFLAVKALDQAKKRFGPPSKRWAQVRIFTDNKDVYVCESGDEWDTTVATKHNQRLADVLFGEEFARLKQRADALLIPEEYMNSVEIDPSIQNGLPIVFDTNILTSVIHNWVQDQYTYKAIKEFYPFIPIENIIGAEAYEAFLDKVSSN